ncbi:hypothetical protein RF55_1261 [Lasius niger]|uniref:Uncharacterized protein n=1 Tax=Lasius niger TaxID=67767 RepID=A0A0J7L6T0_LASNI|nr:hypothetical protein RF55_1261 [Lasius niger]
MRADERRSYAPDEEAYEECKNTDMRDGSDETERIDSYIREMKKIEMGQSDQIWNNGYRVKDGGQVCFTRELSNLK